MPKLRLVAAAVWLASWACAGGDAPEPSDPSGAPPLAQPGQPGATSSATAQLADEADPEVLSGAGNPTTEGSNTNWMPTEPWLDDAHRPPLRGRPDPRKPAGGQQSNMDSAPDPEPPSSPPGQPGPSSSSGSSSASNNSMPSPD
jgi:hypothetical protein